MSHCGAVQELPRARPGEGCGPRSRSRQAFHPDRGEDCRLCNYIDVYNNEYITGGLEFMPATATPTEISRFGLQLGDVIITKDSETPDDIGIAAVADYAAPDLVCGYHLALIHPRKEEVDPTFLAKQLRHHRLARYFGQQANGITRYGLSSEAIAGARLWLPEVTDQRAIGVILRLGGRGDCEDGGGDCEAEAGARRPPPRPPHPRPRRTRPTPRSSRTIRTVQELPLGLIPKDWQVSVLEIWSPRSAYCIRDPYAKPGFSRGTPVITIRHSRRAE